MGEGILRRLQVPPGFSLSNWRLGHSIYASFERPSAQRPAFQKTQDQVTHLDQQDIYDTHQLYGWAVKHCTCVPVMHSSKHVRVTNNDYVQ